MVTREPDKIGGPRKVVEVGIREKNGLKFIFGIETTGNNMIFMDVVTDDNLKEKLERNINMGSEVRTTHEQLEGERYGGRKLIKQVCNKYMVYALFTFVPILMFDCFFISLWNR